jgi:hypothetical protein
MGGANIRNVGLDDGVLLHFNMYTLLQDEGNSLDVDVNVNDVNDANVVETNSNNYITPVSNRHRPIDDRKNVPFVKKHRPIRRSRARNNNATSANNIKITFNNIRGEKSKHYDLYNFVHSNHVNIAGLAETFLKDQDQIKMKGYNWVGKNRFNNVKKSQGGIGFLIKDSVKLLDDNVFNTKVDNYERLWIKVQFTESTDSVYYIAVTYFPCEGINRSPTYRRTLYLSPV